MGHCLNRLDEPVFMAVSKPLLTEFGIHHRLESCDEFLKMRNMRSWKFRFFCIGYDSSDIPLEG